MTLANNWHPCTQMKDYLHYPPLYVASASGSVLTLKNGQKVIDAISSWWCCSLGHSHPRLKNALSQQADHFAHVIFANATHAPIIHLGQKLAALCPGLNKAFYASDGSCAVEIALKMSLQIRKIQGNKHRLRVMALQNSYHGETLLALAASDIGIYRKTFEEILPDVNFLQGLPYLNSTEDPLWSDCAALWPTLQAQLDAQRATLTAIIVEPIVQGAGGMRIYSADFLRRLRAWTLQNDVHLIADEIMTGLGRTGLRLACEHAQIKPDFLCLGKGLTAGWLPMSVVLTTTENYNYFYDDYAVGKTFFHSHTHSGNALAAAVAVECLNILEEENHYKKVQMLSTELLTRLQNIAAKTHVLQNVRGIGAMVAADLLPKLDQPRIAYHIAQRATQMGVLLRPLGNTIYWLPPYTINDAELDKMSTITLQAIQEVY